MERWVHRSKVRPGGQNADNGDWPKRQRWRPAVFLLPIPGSRHAGVSRRSPRLSMVQETTGAFPTIHSREMITAGPAPAFTSAMTPAATAALIM